MKWQPIETAPKDGQFVIGFDPIYRGLVSQVWYCQVFDRWETLHNDYSMGACVDETNWIFECKPTHWMPLPERPHD